MKKFTDFSIEKQDQVEIINRLFGTRIDDVQINGFVQANSIDEFDQYSEVLLKIYEKSKMALAFTITS
jgi:hypothetical protein